MAEVLDQRRCRDHFSSTGRNTPVAFSCVSTNFVTGGTFGRIQTWITDSSRFSASERWMKIDYYANKIYSFAVPPATE